MFQAQAASVHHVLELVAVVEVDTVDACHAHDSTRGNALAIGRASQ